MAGIGSFFFLCCIVLHKPIFSGIHAEAPHDTNTVVCGEECYQPWTQWECVFHVVRMRTRQVLLDHDRPSHCSDRCLATQIATGTCFEENAEPINSASLDDLVDFVSRSSLPEHNHTDTTSSPCSENPATCRPAQGSLERRASPASHNFNHYSCVTDKAEDKEVHVIAVSRASPWSFFGLRRQQVNVNLVKLPGSETRPVDLILSSSRQPIEWVITCASSSIILGNVTLLSRNSRTRHTVGSNCQRTPSPTSALLDWSVTYDGRHSLDRATAINGFITSFTGQREAEAWTLSVGVVEDGCRERTARKEAALNAEEVEECITSTSCWVEFNFRYSRVWTDCHGRRFVHYRGATIGKYIGVVLCTESRYKLFMSDDLHGLFLDIADGSGHGEDHCDFVGGDVSTANLPNHFWDCPSTTGYFRYNSQQSMQVGNVGAKPSWTGKYFVRWYECGVNIPGNKTVVKYLTSSSAGGVTAQATSTPTIEDAQDVTSPSAGGVTTQATSTTLNEDEEECMASPDCWVEFNFTYSRTWTGCHGRQYIRRTGATVGSYIGVVLCTARRYKLFMGDDLYRLFLNIADGSGYGQDHCELIGGSVNSEWQSGNCFDSPHTMGYYRSFSQERMTSGPIGAIPSWTGRYYCKWYECGVDIPGSLRVVELRLSSTPSPPTSLANTPEARMVTTEQPVTHVARQFNRPQNYTAELGSLASFECSTDPPTVVKWYHEDSDHSMETSTNVEVHPEGLLMILSVQQSHAGKYTCKTQSESGPNFQSSAYLLLKEDHLPGLCNRFRLAPENVTLQQREQHIFECEAEITSDITWHRNGRQIPRWRPGRRLGVLLSKKFFIRSSHLDDTGEYSCTAITPNGCRIQHTFRLAVVSRDPDECGLPVQNQLEEGSLEQTGRIVGGEEAPTGSAPWQAMMYYYLPNDPENGMFLCGAILIGRRHVLTAAHCFAMIPKLEIGEFQLQNLELRLGKTLSPFEVEEGEVRQGASNYTLHQGYTDKFDNDIAIIELSSAISYTSRIRPVCLGSSRAWKRVLRSHVLGVTTGWGYEGVGPLSVARSLRQLVLPVQRQTVCKLSMEPLYRDLVTDNMFCAGNGNLRGYQRQDTCSGDSGGPFVVKHPRNNRWYLVGIVSWGHTHCGTQGSYAFFTRVTNYRKWIHDKMAPNNGRSLFL